MPPTLFAMECSSSNAIAIVPGLQLAASQIRRPATLGDLPKNARPALAGASGSLTWLHRRRRRPEPHSVECHRYAGREQTGAEQGGGQMGEAQVADGRVDADA